MKDRGRRKLCLLSAKRRSVPHGAPLGHLRTERLGYPAWRGLTPTMAGSALRDPIYR